MLKILKLRKFRNKSFGKHPLQGSGASGKEVALVSAQSTAVAKLKTASVPPALAKRVGQINNFY